MCRNGIVEKSWSCMCEKASRSLNQQLSQWINGCLSILMVESSPVWRFLSFWNHHYRLQYSREYCGESEVLKKMGSRKKNGSGSISYPPCIGLQYGNFTIQCHLFIDSTVQCFIGEGFGALQRGSIHRLNDRFGSWNRPSPQSLGR
jgi:hypothetical protein